MDTVCKNGLPEWANLSIAISAGVVGSIGITALCIGINSGLALGSLTTTFWALSIGSLTIAATPLMLIITGCIVGISGFFLMIYFLHQFLSESEPLRGIIRENAPQLEQYNNTIGRVFLETGITIERLPTDAYVTDLVAAKEYLNFPFLALAEMEYTIYQGTTEEIYNNSVYDRPFILVRDSNAVIIYQQRYIDEKYEWSMNIIRETGVVCQKIFSYQQCFFLKEVIEAHIRL